MRQFSSSKKVDEYIKAKLYVIKDKIIYKVKIIQDECVKLIIYLYIFCPKKKIILKNK